MGSAEIQGELWGKIPRDWAMIVEPKHTPLWEAMLERTSVGSETRLLDVGCGGGGASVLAAERGAQVSGLDAAEGLVEIARERVPNGDFRIGDLAAMPYEDGHFDVVFAANSVHYSEDRVAALREFGRVCAPDGRIVVGMFGPAETLEVSNIFRAMGHLLPEPPAGEGPFELSAPGRLEGLFEEAGLNVLESGEVDCPLDYPDLETFWRGMFAAGNFQGMLRFVSEGKLKSTFSNASEAYRLDDGRIHIQPNYFKYVAAYPG